MLYLKKAEIKNFRLLSSVEMDFDESLTVLVGKNNTGKTSLMDFLSLLSDCDGRKLDFNDVPVKLRSELYKSLKSFLKGEIDYATLKGKLMFPEIRLTVDYSKEDETDNLGALSPFIIDIDENITEAVAMVRYELVSESAVRKVYADVVSYEKKFANMVKQITQDSFDDICEKVFYAASTKKDSALLVQIGSSEFKALFPMYRIMAERSMDESEKANKEPMRDLFTTVFKGEIQNNDIEEDIRKLKDRCIDAKLDSQKEIDELLASIVKATIGFGYPAAEAQVLTAIADISIEEPIKKADLAYTMEDGERLPSIRNGLGYKNLIKIELELYGFSLFMKKKTSRSVPLLFIEEPEAHMHPQLQQRFIEHIRSATSKILGGDSVQIVISTHSPHIANSAGFDNICYLHKIEDNVESKNLKDFCTKNEENALFIKKYMTLTRCDLFFADKLILVEGTSERLLLPDMIEELFGDKVNGGAACLASQYYTICEVGGAYAHKFIPFVEFLGIPTLIITDIDSVDDCAPHPKHCTVSKAADTSNETIKHWMKALLNNKCADFAAIKNLSVDDRTKGNIHIEWQTEESGLCGRSLEEAIKNVNRKLYDLPDELKDDKELEYNANKDGKKADFALKLLTEEKGYAIPKYIERGLQWLGESGAKK